MDIKKYFRLQTFRRLYLKLVRNQEPPEYTARGVALGLFIGFIVPMGLQIVVVVPLAFLLRTSKVMAIAFTFVTNHLTVFILYPLQCFIGSYLLFHPLTYAEVSGKMHNLIHCSEWREALREMGQLGLEIGAAFFAGGALLGGIAAGLGYFLTLRLIAGYRRARDARRAARPQHEKKS